MTPTWTDGRLDERFDRIDERFDAVDRRLDGVDRRLEGLDVDLRELRSDMQAGFARVDGRIDGLQTTLGHGVVALSASMLTGFVALFTLIATKL